MYLGLERFTTKGYHFINSEFHADDSGLDMMSATLIKAKKSKKKQQHLYSTSHIGSQKFCANVIH